MTLPPLYPILDTGILQRRGMDPVDAAEAILEGGARILQLRHKGHFGRGLFDASERIGALCRQAGAIWVINDRADMARLLDAGLHLGQEDLTPAQGRKIVGNEAVVGFSTHNEIQLRAAAAEPVDYVAMGPIFASGSKERPDPVVGVEGLRTKRPLTSRPLVGIGGITRENALAVLDAGADSLAVIGDIYPEKLSRGTLRERIKEWQGLLQNR